MKIACKNFDKQDQVYKNRIQRVTRKMTQYKLMKFVLIFFCAVLFFSCKPTVQSNVKDLFDVDREFSNSAEEIGFNKAFINYAHPDAVLLRENSMPIVGKATITSIFEKVNTTGINFTWEPIAGDIAKSGELGYTYGIYTLKQDTLTEKGTYISVWKKDENGDWKYILDSGNEGIGE